MSDLNKIVIFVDRLVRNTIMLRFYYDLFNSSWLCHGQKHRVELSLGFNIPHQNSHPATGLQC